MILFLEFGTDSCIGNRCSSAAAAVSISSFAAERLASTLIETDAEEDLIADKGFVGPPVRGLGKVVRTREGYEVRLSPFLVVLYWVLLSIGVGCAGLILGAKTVLPGPSSADALRRNSGELLALEHKLQPSDQVSIIIHPAAGSVDAPEVRAAVGQLVEQLRALRSVTEPQQPLFSRVVTAGYSLLDTEGEIFVSADRSRLLVHASSREPVYQAIPETIVWREALSEWQKIHTLLRVSYLSFGSADEEIFDLIHNDLDTSLLVTLPITFIILAWAFGSVRLTFLPLLVAVVSLIAALGAAAIFSNLIVPISATASQLVVLLVLALGVDYSLFYLSRVREELAQSRGHDEALACAGIAMRPTLVWSGSAVALSLTGLYVMNDTVLTSMASVSIIAVLITVIGAVAALPALLRLIPMRFLRYKNAPSLSVGIGAVAMAVRSPWRSLFISVTPLIALSFAAFSLVPGSVMERHLLPSSLQTRSAYNELQRHFPKLAGPSLSLILSASDLDERESNGEVQSIIDTALSDDQLRGPVEFRWSENRQAARLTFLAKGTANDPENHNRVHQLREYLSGLPAGFVGFVAGGLPYVVDESDRYLARTPWAVVTVLLLSFVVLLLAFRSIVVPIKAILLNSLSTLASYGVLVLLFQSGLIPALHFGVIEGFVPALLFAILFGLSMDYHVLLLSRIQEATGRGLSTRDAVVLAVTTTSRTITSAAAIMAAVFFVVAGLQLPVMKQLGIGLGVAVILDATVIRLVVLPASMMLLGQWNWYLPRWLEWLPHSLEPHRRS